MSNVIQVEGVSKQYRLGTVGTGTIAHDLNRWWHAIRGKEDPYLKIGEENDRSRKGSSDYVWALRDINFNVKQGEVLGIIGKNGAGKSTLLKLLSRTTSPTTGTIKMKGRVASLLEVGTGFHPELSGRDNIYLNGAILGMTRQEVRQKFDEIVDFSGIERYVDTPVKRYSSGMYVRLAFGVAAHLEPDVLIVDEVLAVGDVEFQKKALGKMKEVSTQDGRTVLFVSHNMGSIRSLCDNALILKNGKVNYWGKVEDSINEYLKLNLPSNESDTIEFNEDRKGDLKIIFSSFWVENESNEKVNLLLNGDSYFFTFKLKVNEVVSKVDIGFSIHTLSGDCLSIMYSSYNSKFFSISKDENYLTVKCKINRLSFIAGKYIIRGRILNNGTLSDWPTFNIGQITIENGDFYGTGNLCLNNNAPLLLDGQWL